MIACFHAEKHVAYLTFLAIRYVGDLWMHQLPTLDHGQGFDWGKTSNDYATYRPGPPDSFYDRLRVLGIGLADQRILDLATGTGIVIRNLVKQGAIGAAIDISSVQIDMARKLAQEEGLDIDFRVCRAEETPYLDHTFDIITASQCWWYFDVDRVLSEAKRLLKKNGLLVVAHFNYMPRAEKIAQQTEELILKHNPKWTGVNWSCDVPPMPDWASGKLTLRAMFYYDEPIAFTRESWRGRIRACRGVAASLSPEQVQEFDLEHEHLLKKIAGERFTIMHRMDAHIFHF